MCKHCEWLRCLCQSLSWPAQRKAKQTCNRWSSTWKPKPQTSRHILKQNTKPSTCSSKLSTPTEINFESLTLSFKIDATTLKQTSQEEAARMLIQTADAQGLALPPSRTHLKLTWWVCGITSSTLGYTRALAHQYLSPNKPLRQSSTVTEAARILIKSAKARGQPQTPNLKPWTGTPKPKTNPPLSKHRNGSDEVKRQTESNGPQPPIPHQGHPWTWRCRKTSTACARCSDSNWVKWQTKSNSI